MMKLNIDVNLMYGNEEKAKTLLMEYLNKHKNLFTGFTMEVIDAKTNIEDIMLAIERRCAERKIEYQRFYNSKEYCIVVEKQKSFLFGKAKLYSQDNFDISVGKCLALCRAMGWEDLEHSLINGLSGGQE